MSRFRPSLYADPEERQEARERYLDHLEMEADARRDRDFERAEDAKNGWLDKTREDDAADAKRAVSLSKHCKMEATRLVRSIPAIDALVARGINERTAALVLDHIAAGDVPGYRIDDSEL